MRLLSTMNDAAVQLIVNADDFGMSRQVNQGVIRAFSRGVLTSCSLMVSGDAFQEAVELARQNPGLAVGLHLVAICGKAVLPARDIPALVDSEGRFSAQPTRAGLKYYFSPESRRQLRMEIEAQFEKFKATGLPMSHVDGHLHMHVHPVIFGTILDLAPRYGTRAVRVPCGELGPAFRLDQSQYMKKLQHAFLFWMLSRYMRRKLSRQGLVYADRVFGNLLSGRINERHFLGILPSLQPGFHEIYFHPAERPASSPTAEQRQCALELEALLSPAVRSRLQELGIGLSTYSARVSRQ